MIGVFSRRAPIGPESKIAVNIEHVGGLTRVIPAIAEFAGVNWTTFASSNQVTLPEHYKFSTVSEQVTNHDINIYFAEVPSHELEQSDWFFTHYIWPLLHGLPIPEINLFELELNFSSVRNISHAMAIAGLSSGNSGYFVNDFQLAQVPLFLKELDAVTPSLFFLHTPWPKSVTQNGFAIEVLKFLASGMLAADVIQFQTHKDLTAFETFVNQHLATDHGNPRLEVNPVSVNVRSLQEDSQHHLTQLMLTDSDISYVHIARTDPSKNTMATIAAFTQLAKTFKRTEPRRYLDLYLVPSRQQWPEYQALLSEIGECVAICNSELAALGYLPIRLHVGNDYRRSCAALARYDYLIACSVADGLNLIVKEGAILNTRNGVIISVASVGAMAELGNFCVVTKGVDEKDILQALIAATKLSAETREDLATSLKGQINEFDASHWAESVVAGLKVLETV